MITFSGVARVFDACVRVTAKSLCPAKVPDVCHPERARHAFRRASRGTLRFLLVALLLAFIPVFAQTTDPLVQSKPKATQRVTMAPVGTVTVAAGKSTQVELPFRVAAGYHINSNKPTSELLLPTVITLSPPTNIIVGNTDYPPGQDKRFSFSPDEKLNVYTGDFALMALVRPARNTPPGTYRVRGALKYQACDDRACYPPGQVPVTFDVKVLKAKSGRARRNPAQSPHIHR
jgi:hypothetical protein